MGAAGLVVLGILFLRDQATLGLQLAAGAGLLIFVARHVLARPANAAVPRHRMLLSARRPNGRGFHLGLPNPSTLGSG